MSTESETVQPLTAADLRERAADACYTINYVFGEPFIAISAREALALADQLERLQREEPK